MRSRSTGVIPADKRRGLAGALHLIAYLQRNDATARQVMADCGRCESHTPRILDWLHQVARVMHVVAYHREDGSRGTEVPVYRWGRGDDVERKTRKPGPTRLGDYRAMTDWRKALALLEVVERSPVGGWSIGEIARQSDVKHDAVSRAMTAGAELGLFRELRAPGSKWPTYAPASRAAAPEQPAALRVTPAKAVEVNARNEGAHRRTMTRLVGIPTTVFDLSHHLPDRPATKAAPASVASVFALGDQYRDAA